MVVVFHVATRRSFNFSLFGSVKTDRNHGDKICKWSSSPFPYNTFRGRITAAFVTDFTEPFFWYQIAPFSIKGSSMFTARDSCIGNNNFYLANDPASSRRIKEWASVRLPFGRESEVFVPCREVYHRKSSVKVGKMSKRLGWAKRHVIAEVQCSLITESLLVVGRRIVVPSKSLKHIVFIVKPAQACLAMSIEASLSVWDLSGIKHRYEFHHQTRLYMENESLVPKENLYMSILWYVIIQKRRICFYRWLYTYLL